ncbi:phage tail protein [Campylobacter vulpis]|uniref:phage tail protein n=1 Tax=Campylobacter vulpis TaxID=1655500 RepID=UPI003CFC83DE
MIFCLGEFEFEALNVDELEKNYEYGIRSIERINNHNALISVAKANESIKISGKTLPLSKDKNTYLDTLKQMAKIKAMQCVVPVEFILENLRF